MSVHRRDTCRLCGSGTLSPVLSLTPTPPANAFVGVEALDTDQASYPLDIFFCRDCAHVQLLDVVDPALLFENYVYVSGTSPMFVKHFADYAAAVAARFPLAAGDLVVDIGSNDGTLLKAFREHGAKVLGVDPAQEISRDATKAGVETWTAFFSPDVAARMVESKGPARIVTANNVFAHADDLGGITDGVKALLAPDGVFVFEVSYLADVVADTLFDTIYHEHLAYHSVAPLTRFFAAHDLRLFAAERVASHGGSLRGYVGHADGPHTDDGSVAALVAAEAQQGLDREETFIRFGESIRETGDQLSALLKGFKNDGKTIAGFGAPAKATTLMYHFGIGPDLIEFIVDDSPLKQGLYSPGLHVPVLPSDALYERRPDIAVVLAWNFAQPIIKNHSRFRDQGGRFVVPLPTVEVI